MHVAAFIVVCILAAWLIAYLDHRAKFLELLLDPSGLIFGTLLSAMILYVIYAALKYSFGK
jgi:hypothetical protein